MTDITVEKLGTILDGSEHRDAIHIAVAPAIAAVKLFPGQDVGFSTPENTEIAGPCDHPIGIVDPFLKSAVYPEQRFFIFLYPRTITSLRHDWTHPAFSKQEPDKSASEKWMEEFASNHSFLTYEEYQRYDESIPGRNYTAAEVIEYAREFLLTGDKHIQQGSESLRNRTVPEEFWKHFEIIAGMKVADYHRDQVPFSCTC